MAARANLEGPSRPMLVPDRWDIPPESVVRLTTDQGHKVIGSCYKNPIHTASTNAIELVNCQVHVAGKGNMKSNFRRFFSSEIVEMSFEKKKEESLKEIPEKLMITHEITKMEQIRQMVHTLKDLKVEAIAVSLQGINVSRDGTLGWICLVTKGLLICIDVLAFTDNEEFWKIMEKEIFYNSKLQKVIHNARPMVDFLFHNHAIKVSNIFDTQLTELYIRCHLNRERMPKSVDARPVPGSEYNWEFNHLSKCLEKFLQKDVRPEELKHLKQFEQMDFSRRNPLMERPLKSDSLEVKCVAISVKHLLDLRQAQIQILLSHVTDCMKEEVILMMKGNMADHIKNISDPSFVAHNIFEKMMEAKPSISLKTEMNLN